MSHENNMPPSTSKQGADRDLPPVPSKQELKKKLTPEQYAVTQQKGTEPPFSGTYATSKETGQYVCVCCGAPLFSSKTKFESGTGWPSFYEPIQPGAVGKKTDPSLGMQRTEVICQRCGAHLGHVFTDAPQQPTGLRFCINSAALNLKKGAEPKPRQSERTDLGA